MGAAEGRDLVRTGSNITGDGGGRDGPGGEVGAARGSGSIWRIAPRGRTKPGPGQEEEGGHRGLEESGAEQQEGKEPDRRREGEEEGREERREEGK